MGILEAVKKGFTQTSKLMSVVLVFFVFNLVVGIISLPLANPERADDPGIMAISIVSSLLFFLIFIFLQGGALGLIKDHLKTASASMAQYTGYGKKFYVRILGLLLLYILIAVGVVLIISLISAGLLLLGDNIATRSIVATIVTVIAIAVITFLVYPIYSIVVDDIGPIAALKKGLSTSKEHFWRTLGLFLTMLIASLIISLVVGLIVGMISVPLPVNISQILIAIVNAAVQAYIPVVMMVAFMAFYLAITEQPAAPQQEAAPQV